MSPSGPTPILDSLKLKAEQQCDGLSNAIGISLQEFVSAAPNPREVEEGWRAALTSRGWSDASIASTIDEEWQRKSAIHYLLNAEQAFNQDNAMYQWWSERSRHARLGVWWLSILTLAMGVAILGAMTVLGKWSLGEQGASPSFLHLFVYLPFVLLAGMVLGVAYSWAQYSRAQSGIKTMRSDLPIHAPAPGRGHQRRSEQYTSDRIHLLREQVTYGLHQLECQGTPPFYEIEDLVDTISSAAKGHQL